MRDFEILRNLIGETVTERDLKYVDCYVQHKLGIFIPFGDGCGYAAREQHTHPAYMIVIWFGESGDAGQNPAPDFYPAQICSPGVPHTDDAALHPYYCVMIDREYFEEEYRKYADPVPHFDRVDFRVCRDILKTLNLFAFEYSKQTINSDITLEAQAVIITHWLIRSILGENCDMRTISDHYAVARAQHFMEQHFAEEITVGRLAALGNISVSAFNRIFKKELRQTPIEYLIELRLQEAQKLLRRSGLSVTQVALRCGFNSSSHLTSSFKRVLHVTPSEYRKLYSGH